MEHLSAQQRSTVIDAIQTHLVHEPLKETRNRKPLRPNPIAPWELRIGALRVFYEAPTEPPNTVNILAVGIKARNKLLIAGQEIAL